MENIIRTATGALLQTSQLIGVPYVVEPYTTLNEKLGVNTTDVLNLNDRPTLKYIGIGNGGHKASIGTDGYTKVIPVQHTPKHTGLYNQLPFLLRKLTDETMEERSKYRMRRVETHGGIQYAAYYLKEINYGTTIPNLELRTVNNSETSISTFVPEASDMNPIPPALVVGYVLRASGDYIAAAAKVPFSLTLEEVNNFIEACVIIYGDASYATISEIALCSGSARMINAYNEAICVQVINFITCFYPMSFINDELNLLFDVGSVEPLLSLTSNEF